MRFAGSRFVDGEAGQGRRRAVRPEGVGDMGHHPRFLRRARLSDRRVLLQYVRPAGRRANPGRFGRGVEFPARLARLAATEKWRFSWEAASALQLRRNLRRLASSCPAPSAKSGTNMAAATQPCPLRPTDGSAADTGATINNASKRSNIEIVLRLISHADDDLLLAQLGPKECHWSGTCT